MKLNVKTILISLYKIIIQSYYTLICNINLMRYSVFGNKKINYKDIPIVINNRNRYTLLKKLVDNLENKGYRNLIILDNNSTYAPLLEYYKTLNHRIIYLEKNLGFLALEKISLYKQIKKNYFVYTDPDILPIEDCPSNFLEFFLNTLIKFPQYQKIGFSLKIDDIPDCYKMKNKVIEWERKYYRDRFNEHLYVAPIDTTFALHRPFARISTKGRLKMFRANFPYMAYHLPWYIDSDNLNEEEKFYLDHVEIGTHWSTGFELNKKTFLNIFKK